MVIFTRLRSPLSASSAELVFGWRRLLLLLTYCLAICIGVAHSEHDIDLGHHVIGDDVLIPTTSKLHSAYFVPFRAVDTARYLSALRRHKRSLWLVPTMETADTGNFQSQQQQHQHLNGNIHHRRYRAHQPEYVQLAFM